MKRVQIKFDVRGQAAGLARFLMAHFGAMLIMIFFISVAVWAAVFWYYGTGAARHEPDIEMKIMKIKGGDLKKILDDISAREAAIEIISEKSIPNPFIKPVAAQ